MLWRSDLDVLGQWLAVTGVSVAALVGWVARGITQWRSGGDTAKAPYIESAAADLATAVRRTWSREAVHRGLTSPLPIAVRVRTADPRIAAHPAQWGSVADAATPGSTSAEAALTGTVTDMVALYGRVATGRLVIVGAPGSGKTGAAVLLLLALCDRFPLGSWNPGASTIEQWMAGQLATTYGTPRAVARMLVEDGHLLPVLDGLDEVPEGYRAAVMAGLRALGTDPLVLTCRTTEYGDAVIDQILAAAAVVELVPVDPATATDYLTRSGSADIARWDRVIAALHAPASTPCQEALRSPLMLSLARTVYQARASNPSELTIYPLSVLVRSPGGSYRCACPSGTAA